MSTNPYPQTLTPSESEFGFQKIQIDSKYEGLCGPELWPAWACKVGKSDYFVKTSEGQYKQMRYGYRFGDKTKKCEWHPCGNDFKTSLGDLPTLTLEDTDFLLVVGVDYETTA